MKWNRGRRWLNTGAGAQRSCGNLHPWRYYNIDWATDPEQPHVTLKMTLPWVEGRTWQPAEVLSNRNYSVILWKVKSRPFSKVSCYSTRDRSLAAFFIRLPTCFCGVGEKDLQKHHEKREARTEVLLLPARGGTSWSRQPALESSSENHSFPVHPTGQKDHPWSSTLHIPLNHSVGCPVSILIFLFDCLNLC